MADEPFYAPNRRVRSARVPKPTEPLWELRREGVTWSAELLFHGESWGWEARIVRQGEFVQSHRFQLRAQAGAWAEQERQDIEKGWRM